MEKYNQITRKLRRLTSSFIYHEASHEKERGHVSPQALSDFGFHYCLNENCTENLSSQNILYAELTRTHLLNQTWRRFVSSRNYDLSFVVFL